MNPYQKLPDPPKSINSAGILIRLIDSIGYRFHLATNGLTDNEINFRPVDGSMDMMELLNHMYRVLFWAYRAFNPDAKINKEISTYSEYHQGILNTCIAFSNYLEKMTGEEIEKVSVHLRRTDTTYSFWYLINGPITDILTHIGQINSWRRIAGNPCPRISPFTGEAY